MSGTSIDPATKDALERLEAVLDRRIEIAAIVALANAVNGRLRKPPNVKRVAIGVDSSVFMRMATDRRSADILDYLPRHEAPLIIPGQVIQEFWNNQLRVVETVSDAVKRRFDALAVEMRKVDAGFGDFEQHMLEMLGRFQSEYGYVYDENTRNNVAKMLAILQDGAFCTFVPRTDFSRLAESRKRTRTPPGFKDDMDGDFFVWADFLFGLLVCASRGESFEQVVLLTNDRKVDWSAAGTPHPLLSAEVDALFGVPFDLWTLDEFAGEIAGAV